MNKDIKINSNLRVLFALTISLKILSVIGAFYYRDYRDASWILGFVVPLFFMLLYVFVGSIWVRNSSTKTILNYGDSCYYLGFLFTIASIILALLDVGMNNFTLNDIAVRFATAMITTFIGMIVRIFLVTFTNSNYRKIRQRDIKTSSASSTSSSPYSGINSSSDPNSASNLDNVKGFNNLNDYDEFIPSETTPEDGFQVIIEANCRNLDQLNSILITTIEKFEHLRSNMSEITTKTQMDLERSTLIIEDVAKTIAKQNKENSDAILSSFKDSLDSTLSILKENLKNNIVESLQIIQDEAKAQYKLSTENINSLSHMTFESIKDSTSKFAEQIDQGAKQVNDSTENLVKQIQQLNKPYERFYSDIETTSSKLNNVVDNFDNSMSNFSQKVEHELEGLANSVANATTHTEKLGENIKTISEIASTHIKKRKWFNIFSK